MSKNIQTPNLYVVTSIIKVPRTHISKVLISLKGSMGRMLHEQVVVALEQEFFEQFWGYEGYNAQTAMMLTHLL